MESKPANLVPPFNLKRKFFIFDKVDKIPVFSENSIKPTKNVHNEDTIYFFGDLLEKVGQVDGRSLFIK